MYQNNAIKSLTMMLIRYNIIYIYILYNITIIELCFFLVTKLQQSKIHSVKWLSTTQFSFLISTQIFRFLPYDFSF